MGVGDTFHQTPVGVFFGRDGKQEPGVEVEDPFFGGAGPSRTGCIECGECMTGCRHGAKNTLLKNYLVPGREGRRRGAPADDCHRVRPLGRRRLRGRHRPHRALRDGRTTFTAARSSSPPAPTAPRGCCTGCGTRATCPASRRGWAS